MSQKSCNASACVRPAHTRGYCEKHYKQVLPESPCVV